MNGSLVCFRVDAGEELIESIKRICESLDISAGFLHGIGAANIIEIGVYEVGKKIYHKQKFEDDYELASVMGNISRKDGECYLHLHGVIGGMNKSVVAGHINFAKISATFEGFIFVFGDAMLRVEDQMTSLNLLSFDQDVVDN